MTTGNTIMAYPTKRNNGFNDRLSNAFAREFAALSTLCMAGYLFLVLI